MKRWSKSETEKLKQMYLKKCTLSEIAAVTGRTMRSVQSKIGEEKLTLLRRELSKSQPVSDQRGINISQPRPYLIQHRMI